MTHPHEKSQVFLAPLHGLRGLAVLFVLISHFSNSQLYLTPFDLGGLGKVGVWLFFSLSAFLLTRQLVADVERSSAPAGKIRDYLIKRFFRIYPLYVLVLVIHLAGDINLADVGRHILLQDGRGELWAIPVEFKYYMVMPLLAWVAVRFGVIISLQLVSVLLLASLYLATSNPAQVFSNELGLMVKAAPFLLGSLLALAWPMNAPRPSNSRWPLILSVVSVVAFIPLAWGFRLAAKELIAASYSPWLSLAMGLCVCALIYGSLTADWLERITRNRVLVYFGEISFSLYLLHMLVIHVMLKVPFVPSWSKAWLTLLACVCLAHLSHRFVELPGMNCGKWLVRRLRPQPVGTEMGPTRMAAAEQRN